jgi:hypothetical protein
MALDALSRSEPDPGGHSAGHGIGIGTTILKNIEGALIVLISLASD